MTNPSKRIGYIDALRGFTMILVIFSHIPISNQTDINQVFILFRMPLFFFISGFISFRREQSWSGADTLSRLRGKVRTMILPATLVGLIYTLAYNQVYDPVPITDLFTRTTKMGYWFTFALFNMLFIYYTARYLAERKRASLESFVKWFFVLGIVCFAALGDLGILGNFDTVLTLSRTFKYLQFFAFGALCSYHRDTFERVVSDGAKMATFALCFAALAWWILSSERYIEAYNLNAHYVSIFNSVLRCATGYLGIVIVYGAFRYAGNFFSNSRLVGKPLQFVGRNTLDVYLLHYFVLLPPMLNTIAVEHIPPVVLGIVLSIAITSLSLLISRIIRISDVMAYYLLGARDVKLNVQKS